MAKETIENLFNKYSSLHGITKVTEDGHELVDPHGLQVRTKGGFKSVKWLSRHKTSKPILEVHCDDSSVKVTTDHVCMAYNDDNMLEGISGKDLKPGMSILVNSNGNEIPKLITKITPLGKTEDYVYDMEIEDDSHVFYGNDILVHNSLFLNLDAVTQDFAVKHGNQNNDICTWDDPEKIELWNHVSKFVEDTLIPQVQDIVTKMCHTSNSSVLRYGLEYIGSGGIYESKKHYGVHKVIDEGPELVDKFKFTGIEIKKATVPPEVKKFLKDIYCKAILDRDFNDSAMQRQLSEVYDKIKNMSVDEIGQWRGYNTECKMGEGFLNAQKGMTGISKAVGYYNQVVVAMGIAKKYGTIELGDKVQTVYIKSANKYGIDVIAFRPRNWPKEFDDVFEIDRPKMFDKLIMSPLKNFFEALHFAASKDYNPATFGSLAFSVDDL